MKKKIILLSIFAVLLMLSTPVMSSIQVEKVTNDIETLQTVKEESKCPLCAMGFTFEKAESIQTTDDANCAILYIWVCILVKTGVETLFMMWMLDNFYRLCPDFVPSKALFEWCVN